MIPSPDLLPDEPMPAPQRPMRRAPQMRKTMPPRAAQVQRRAADAIPPASGQTTIRPMLPGQTGHGQAAPGSLPPAPVIGFPRRRSPPAPLSPRSARAIPFPHFFPPASVPTHPRRPPSLPERPFRSDLHSGAFHRAPVFSPAPVKPRAAPALLPFPARIPTSPPRSALSLVPASDPPRFPRAFSCAFPALLPHSIPPFCASFVKKHHKVRAAAQNLCNAAHLRALRPGLRSNCPATSPAGHRSPT